MLPRKKILFLHGYTQTGDIFKSRVAVLAKQLQKLGYETCFPSGIVKATSLFPSNGPPTGLEACWWNSSEDRLTYIGLEDSVLYIKRLHKEEGPFSGIIGFSQGAAFASIIAGNLDPPPDWLVCSGGFLPRSVEAKNLINFKGGSILHVMGSLDEMVPLMASQELLNYMVGEELIHDGGHILPGKSLFRQQIVNWIVKASSSPTTENKL